MDPRRKTSDVWSFFEPVSNYIALCKICKTSLSYKSSVSNLKKHLQRKHPTVALPTISTQTAVQSLPRTETSSGDILQIGPDVQENLVVESSSHFFSPERPTTSRATDTFQNQPSSFQLPVPTSKKQMSISTYIPKKLAVSDKNKIDEAIMKLFIWDLQPFTVVEDRGFRNLMNTCAPSYQIPSRKYFANTLLPAYYETKVNEMKESIKKDAPSVCLTTDTWSSSTNETFNAITAHYINQDFEMKHILLDCSVIKINKTSQNLADEILRIINEWDLSGKISIVITDNAINITSAIQSILKWKHFGCYAHTLNLIVQDSLLIVNDIIKKVKTIVTFFKRSNIAHLKITKYQEQIGVQQPKKLLQDVTRWNSVYYMLK